VDSGRKPRRALAAAKEEIHKSTNPHCGFGPGGEKEGAKGGPPLEEKTESTDPHFHIVERHFLEKKSTAGAGGARQCSGWLFAWII
jgi:hypothetical protein